jgi:hypothetical protein
MKRIFAAALVLAAPISHAHAVPLNCATANQAYAFAHTSVNNTDNILRGKKGQELVRTVNAVAHAAEIGNGAVNWGIAHNCPGFEARADEADAFAVFAKHMRDLAAN